MTIALVVAALGATACVGDASSGEADLKIVVTTTILGDVVQNLVGEDASVEVLIPVGADSHDFRPSSAQIAQVSEADLVVANGLALEEGLLDVLGSAEADGVEVLEVAPLLDPLPFDRPDGLEEEPGEDQHSEDPHVWLDPLRMAEAARLIAARLAEISSATDWVSRAEGYAAELAATDDEIMEILSAIPRSRRRLVTSHDSMGYFAARYDFEIVGVIIPGGSTLGDPSSGELAALIDVMKRENIDVIFGETTQPSALAEAVADELGVDIEIVSLYTGSLGEPGSGADTLTTMLITNAELIAEALGE